MFRSGIVTSLMAATLIAAPIGARQATADSHAGPQINIEARFIEVERAFVNEIGIDFRSLDAAPDSPFVGGMAPGVVPLLVSSGRATVLASPRVSVVREQTATIKASGKLSVPSGIPGNIVTFDDFGLQLQVTPLLRSDGTIGLELDIARDGLDLGPKVPEIRTYRTGADLILPNGETAVIGGLISERLRNQANRVPGLARLPVLGSLFRTKQQAQAETTLLVLITPTVGGQGRGSASGGSAGSGSAGGGQVAVPAPPREVPTQTSFGPTLLGLKPGQLYISAGAGAIFQDMSNFNWTRLQSDPDHAFLSEDTDIVAPQVIVDGGIGLNQGLFGGLARMAFSYGYIDGDVDSFRESLSAQSSNLEIEFPDGGGTTVLDTDSDLEDVDFGLSYQAIDVTLKIYEELPAGNKGLTVGGGLAFRYADTDASLSFVTNGFNDQYERRDEIENWSVGPVIGAYLSNNYGLLTAYGGAEVRALASIVDGRTTVDLDNNPLDNLDLSKTRFTYDLNLTAGARFNLDPVKIDLRTSVGYGNNHPMIVYRQGNEAEVEFDSNYDWAARASLIYLFY